MVDILIIEDDPYVRRFYQRLFELNHIQAEMAENGLIGLARAKALRPKLIFLDILMPGMNGMEVLKQLKDDPQTANCDIIVLTNLNEPQLVKEAMSLGASDYLVKSDTSEDKILSAARSHLTPPPSSAQTS